MCKERRKNDGRFCFSDFYRLTHFCVNKANLKPINNVAIRVTLFAKHKNNYSLLPPNSDRSGNIVIGKSDFEKEIDESKSLFIMDYSSDLEDCFPKIEIEVMDEEKLKNAVKAQISYQYILHISDWKIKMLKNADNKYYVPLTKVVEFTSDDSVIKIKIQLETQT